MERELKRVDTIARVRRAFHVQGWSVKKIVRELHVSRNNNHINRRGIEQTVLEAQGPEFCHSRMMFARGA